MNGGPFILGDVVVMGEDDKGVGEGGVDKGIIVRGLEDLRGGIRLYLISIILLIVGSIFILVLLVGPSIASIWISGGPARITRSTVVALIILMAILVLAVSTIAIFAVMKVRDGMRELVKAYKDADVGLLGARLILYGTILIVAGILTLLIVVGAILAIVGVLVLIVGNILFGVGIVNLDKYTREDLKTPGILYIVGVAVSLLGSVVPGLSLLGQALELAGLILLYVRLGGWIEDLKVTIQTATVRRPY